MAFRPYLRTALGLITSLLLTLATLTVLNTVGAGIAYADPDPPPGASDAAKQLARAQEDAEELTEQWHEAQDEMDVKQDAAQRAKDDVEPARRAVVKAKANEERYRTEVDPMVTEAYESGRLDQLNVLITSDSPSDFLDQMTTLDSFTADRLAVLNHMVDLTTQSTRAQADADDAAKHAQQAADDAKAAYTQIGVRKKEAEVRIDQAEKLLAKLDPAERARRIKDDGGPIGGAARGQQGCAGAQGGHHTHAAALRMGRDRAQLVRLLGSHVLGVQEGRHHTAAFQFGAGQGGPAGVEGRPATR